MLMRRGTAWCSPQRMLKYAVFITGLCGIVSEYVLSTIASYLLGDTIVQWVLVISLFLFAMGWGSRLTKRVTHGEVSRFVLVECLLAAVVAFAPPLAYGVSAYPHMVSVVVYGASVVVGVLIGMEIPLIIRINSRFETLSLNLGNVLEKDYLGALVGGVFFVFIGLPKMGVVSLGLLLGLLNWCVAVAFWFVFREREGRRIALVIACVGMCIIGGSPFATAFASWGEERKYRDTILYTHQSVYQRIVITKWREFFWLYLDGHEQFSSYDEYRYHECLVHPAMVGAAARRDVLVLGGGDGLAVREVLKYPDVQQVTLVDIDPAVTTLAREYPLLVDLNKGSLHDPRVTVIHEDAGSFVNASSHLWDVIIVDLPDPRNPSVERLYTVEFYRSCKKRLSKGGVLVTQATSPLFSPYAFWSVVKTMREAGFETVPLHAHVPTFGEWGWVVGTDLPGDVFKSRVEERWRVFSLPLRFLNVDVVRALFVFSPADTLDLRSIQVHSTLSPVLSRYYRQGLWGLY